MNQVHVGSIPIGHLAILHSLSVFSSGQRWSKTLFAGEAIWWWHLTVDQVLASSILVTMLEEWSRYEFLLLSRIRNQLGKLSDIVARFSEPKAFPPVSF